LMQVTHGVISFLSAIGSAALLITASAQCGT
jgi:hypothetical protein